MMLPQRLGERCTIGVSGTVLERTQRGGAAEGFFASERGLHQCDPAQRLMIVQIFVARADGQNVNAQERLHRVPEAIAIAPVGDGADPRCHQSDHSIGLAQQCHAAIAGDFTALKVRFDHIASVASKSYLRSIRSGTLWHA